LGGAGRGAGFCVRQDANKISVRMSIPLCILDAIRYCFTTKV
jgi:hypothetical protein